MPKKKTSSPTPAQPTPPVDEARKPRALAGKVAIVTGGATGIGFAIAKALATHDCTVVIAGRNEQRLRSAVLEITGHGGRAARIACDVRVPASVFALFTATRMQFGRLDILVNNAGIAHPMSSIDDLPVDTWNDVIATNLTGMFLCARAAAPLLEPGGVIVNNLSVAATGVFAGEAAYIASKWGAKGLTDTLREELRPRGIRVLGLVPGATDTAIWEQFWPDAPHDQMISPDDVARAVLLAVTMPEKTALDEIRIGPTRGQL